MINSGEQILISFGEHRSSGMFSRMLKLGIKTFQVTLDGFEEEHNAGRHLINGDGTFNRIWSNLLAIKDSAGSFTIKIRVHYTEDNYRGLVPFLQYIKNELLDDTRFKIYFRPIEKFGGKNDSEITSIPFKRQQEITEFLQSVIANKSSLHEKEETYICYASQLNSFIIRSNGMIQKCDLGLDLDANNVGKLNPDGTMSINRDKFLMWSRGLETRDPEMLSCPYFYFFADKHVT